MNLLCLYIYYLNLYKELPGILSKCKTSGKSGNSLEKLVKGVK